MNSHMYGRGWFEGIINALTEGDLEFFIENSGIIPSLREAVDQTLETLTHAGMSRHSRKGWETIEHPTLGCLQWKRGLTTLYGEGFRFLFLRRNGKLILRASPKEGDMKYLMTPNLITFPEGEKRSQIEKLLGNLERGSLISQEERRNAYSRFNLIMREE